MYRRGSRLLIGIVWILSVAIVATADEQKPEEVLKSKGLRKLSSYFSLPEETQLGKQVRDAAKLKKKLLDAQRNLAICEKKVEEKQKLIVFYLQKRRELRAQLANTRLVTVHNRLVTALNELADRIALMQQAGHEEKALKAAQATAGYETEQYIEHLLKTRKLYDKIKEQYEDLAADNNVKAAIQQYSRASDKTCKLGPSLSFLSYGRRLHKLEETVLSESIDLRRGRGNLWHVSVMLNGKHTLEMAIDTGASVVCLPWKAAEAAGLTPTAQNPTVRLTLADGRTIEGKRVVADTVRVGKFAVGKVECAVFPEQLVEAKPLLGLSFLKHFIYKIDTTGSKLIMSKVETPDVGGRPQPKRTK